MFINRKLAEIDVRLEEAVASLPGEPANPAELYDRYEMVAIQILDSEAGDYAPGVLQEYALALAPRSEPARALASPAR